MQTPYFIRGGYLGETLCRIYVMRSNIQFHISVKASDTKHTPLGLECFQLIDKVNALDRPDMETCFAPYNLILMHFLPLLEKLAPATDVDGMSIEDFFYAPTYHLNVTSEENGELGIRGEEICTLTPAHDMAPLSLSSSSAPGFYQAIPKTSAKDLILAKSAKEMDPLKPLQGKVKPPGGDYKFFKPRERGRETEFAREVQLLHQIKETGLAGRVHRLPTLESLVVAGEQEDQVVIGFLLNFIVPPSLGCHLLSPVFKDQIDMHKKWEEQVRVTVTLLHKHDIVWGDVNPCNVAVDEDMNAWVIDFGGRNNAEFVDDDKAETVEGDWQGVQRLFGEWLPSRRDQSRACECGFLYDICQNL